VTWGGNVTCNTNVGDGGSGACNKGCMIAAKGKGLPCVHVCAFAIKVPLIVSETLLILRMPVINLFCHLEGKKGRGGLHAHGG
jgi:hypothetical protein